MERGLSRGGQELQRLSGYADVGGSGGRSKGISRWRTLRKLLRLRPCDLDHCTFEPFGPTIVPMKLDLFSFVLRLDCLSCVLTVCSTILVGRRCWEGWVLAAANSLIICVIGLRTAQLGFIPANLFCIVLYAVNLRTWRKAEVLPAEVCSST